jgi:N-acetylmuramoyl-L-alanine amidase
MGDGQPCEAPMKRFILLSTGLLLFVLGCQSLSNPVIEVVVAPQPLPEPEPIEVPPPLGPIVVLDPGHGPLPNREREPIAPGSSTLKAKYGVGARGVSGTFEREVNLNVAWHLKAHLEAANYRVHMTRTTHEDIASNIDRAELANALNADLFLRIHADSHPDASIHGALVLVPGARGYVVDQVERSREMAQIVLDTLVEHVGMKKRGVFSRTDQTGFNWSKVPVFTIELGFLSNPEEDARLADDAYQQALAWGLFQGIERIFNPPSE